MWTKQREYRPWMPDLVSMPQACHRVIRTHGESFNVRGKALNAQICDDSTEPNSLKRIQNRKPLATIHPVGAVGPKVLILGVRSDVWLTCPVRTLQSSYPNAALGNIFALPVLAVLPA
jgi:hypothetical protein